MLLFMQCRWVTGGGQGKRQRGDCGWIDGDEAAPVVSVAAATALALDSK